MIPLGHPRPGLVSPLFQPGPGIVISMFSVKYIIQQGVFRDYVQAGGPGQARGKHPQYHGAGVKRPGRVSAHGKREGTGNMTGGRAEENTHRQYCDKPDAEGQTDRTGHFIRAGDPGQAGGDWVREVQQRAVHQRAKDDL